MPAIIQKENCDSFSSEREILYKVLFDMKSDMHDLKKLVIDLLDKGYNETDLGGSHAEVVQKLYQSVESPIENTPSPIIDLNRPGNLNIQDTEELVDESLSLEDKEIEMIKKALDKWGYLKPI